MTLRVELVIPEGEIWAGNASMVIAKTLDGDIGVLTGHTPVLGILAEGSVVRIMADSPERPAAQLSGAGQSAGPSGVEQSGAAGAVGEVTVAVSGGFFAVADNRVSVLARQAQLGREADVAAVRAELEAELEKHATLGPEAEEPAQVRYLRALLRAAHEPADRA